MILQRLQQPARGSMRVVGVAVMAAAAIGCADTDVPTARATPGGTSPTACDAEAAAGVEVAAGDGYGGAPYALGYPPYALDGCTLVYVAAPSAGATAGALVRRNLADLSEDVLAEASEAPRRPAVAGDVVAWEATLEGRSVVRVRAGDAEAVTALGAFDHAGEPRAAADAVVFTGWTAAGQDGDSDVFLWVVADAAVSVVADGPGQQRFADVSADHVAWSDFAEDADGTFDQNEDDVADVGVLDRVSGARHLRQKSGKQAFPMLDGGKLGFLDWGLVHPEPKFSEYDVFVGDVEGPPEADVLVAHVKTSQPYLRPTAKGAIIEWIEKPFDTASLWRRPIDLSMPAARVEGIGGDLYGPAASAHITVVAQGVAGGKMLLVSASK